MSVLHLMVDTCVWLDTAKDPRGERLIATVRTLVAEGELELLVPMVIRDEFTRNRDHVVSSLTTSMKAHIRTARAVLAQHSQSEVSEQLVAEFESAATRGPLIHEFVVNRFTEVSDLLVAGRQLEPDDDVRARVVERALAKNAPFHRARNSVADALLVELFRQAWSQTLPSASEVFVFVTHNTKDFSSPADLRDAHPDLQDCFADLSASYAVSLEGALALGFSDVAELLEEFDLQEEVRSGQEILAAERKFFDLVWYHRSLDSLDFYGSEGRRRVEETYPRDELGPYTDFQWGMLNGKLSALRWVTGDEWDFLDT